MFKKISFFIALVYLSGFVNNALSEIIPLKKPIQTKEETEKKLLIDILRPLPKPIKKTELENVTEEIVVKKKILNELILPKKKTINCWI